jgi:hypothetical protein
MSTPDYPIFANSTQYQAVAAGLGPVAIGPGGGGQGDYLSHITIVPASVSPGVVTITDGSGSAITVFAGGASSLSSLAPFTVAIGAKSTSGAWKITTGASVSAIAVGQFT